MTGPAESTLSSQWLSQLQNAAHAQDFTLEPWQRVMAESFLQDITERRLVHRTAPTPLPRSVNDQFTLKLTASLTQQDMGFHYTVRNSTQPTPPAILALAFSLMQEFHPWSSSVSIEIRHQ
jgi:hypothetical protein